MANKQFPDGTPPSRCNVVCHTSDINFIARMIRNEIAVLVMISWDQEYISSESMQLPWTAFLRIDITSVGENYISGGVVV